ncbi:MED14-domain-containing protein [Plenodomus tracheiphilus IPT5]|uniref:Mediator of RNA polymerase II transcription subunit 14 n=1 Tax=Plenodomus tracheiphilus IPT5 TaxID=1408161 RepID=A0A6A7B718_9PLEO|nr:MED14-domain-containing protein [Plenodomus tracheiphilus IPT5]
MPGILMMDPSAPNAAAAAHEGDSKKRDSDGMLLNGSRIDARRDTPAGASVNGVPPQDVGTNGASMAVAGPGGRSPDRYAETPPELNHIPSDAYNPLSVMLQRTAQECFNDIGDVLTKLADMPLGPTTNGALNGTGPHGQESPEAKEANMRKKLLLLKFAQDSRSKFIKLLVLTEWGKKAAHDVSKLIDLFAWTQEQSAHMDCLDEQLQRIKIHTNMARENNPDINTALEILSTGKASWMPALDFISPEPISSEQALKLLQHMNTSLSIRLNLHETLPRHLRNWRIHSGRATFVIPNEFEFDVISFVEDSSSQWSFIDIRLLFSPAPVITVGSPFFMTLKFKADEILGKSGLSGLFDYLQNFILTHKISVLRSQAVGLVRSGRAGSLKVEPVHRELIVQYWMNRPGKKNWIDIGVSHNRPRNGKVSWRGPPLPTLKARWFCEGQEVKDARLKFDWTDLSMERIVKQITARHTNDILRATRDGIESKLKVDLQSSPTEPADCMLKTTLGPMSNSITMSLEPVTGRYILQPANAITARAEHAFNLGREPAVIGQILIQALAQTLLTSIQGVANQLGWQPVSKQALQANVVKDAVKLDLIQYALYCPRGWSSKWALAAVIDSKGESWWVLRLSSTGSAVLYAEDIKMSRPDGSSLSINRKTLASLGRVAVQLISFRVTAQQLEREKKSCSLRYDFARTDDSAVTENIARGWALHIQTSDLLVTPSDEQPWLQSTIAVHCEGLRAEGQHVWHIATGHMVKSAAADMQKLMAASPPSSFKFSEDGCFRILLSTRFGHDVLGELRARLRDVNRLRSFATTLQKRKMRLGSSSLQRVQFEYGPSPHIAAINFASEKEFSVEISPKNPHHRVLHLLTAIANDRMPGLPATLDSSDANGLDRFCSSLILTRSMVKVLAELESRRPGNVKNPAIHVHSIFKYRITYENPVCTFDVHLEPKDDKVYWLIEDNYRTRSQDTRPTPERRPGHRRLDNLQAKLKELFGTKGEGWFGTRNGIVAELDAVPDALRKLDTHVMECMMEGGYQAPPPLEQPAQTQGQMNGVQQGNQQQINQQRIQQQQQQARQQQQQNHAQAQAQAQTQQRRQSAQQQSRGQLPNARGQQRGGGAGAGRGGRAGQSKQDVITID